MSASKSTLISGYTAGYAAPTAPPGTAERNRQADAAMEHYRSAVRRGHWSPGAAIRLARQAGITGPVEIVHTTYDMSGKGRSSTDRRFIGDESGVSQVNP